MHLPSQSIIDAGLDMPGGIFRTEGSALAVDTQRALLWIQENPGVLEHVHQQLTSAGAISQNPDTGEWSGNGKRGPVGISDSQPESQRAVIPGDGITKEEAAAIRSEIAAMRVTVSMLGKGTLTGPVGPSVSPFRAEGHGANGAAS